MTLDKDALATDLENVFTSMLATAAEVADALASVYTSYASACAFGASTVTIPPAKTEALAAAFLSVLATPATGSAPAFAAAWASGVAAFWVGNSVVGAQAGAVTACAGAASLVATLTPIFANNQNTAAAAAQDLATAIHTATLTTLAAVAPPPGTVLPIS